MPRFMKFGALVILALAAASNAAAQPPASPAAKDYSQSPYVTRLMAFDKKHDGKLTRDEITDRRLLRLFDEADANKDGIVTKEELMALAAKKESQAGFGDQGWLGGGSPAGTPAGSPAPSDGPPNAGPGGFGPGGPRGRGGPPQPAQILSGRLQDELKLTDDQKSQLAALQKEVDEKLTKILSDEQQKQLKQMRDHGPGGRGPGGPPEPPGPPPN